MAERHIQYKTLTEREKKQYLQYILIIRTYLDIHWRSKQLPVYDSDLPYYTIAVMCICTIHWCAHDNAFPFKQE